MMRKSLWITGLVLLAVVLTFGAALAQAGGDPENGARLYAENCLVCHGENGEGRTGAELNDAFVSVNPEAFIRDTISNGRPGTLMPTWGEDNGGPLTDEEIDDLIAYVATWGGVSEPVLPVVHPPQEDIPPVAGVDGDPNEGAVVFAQNCAVCHGETGSGRIGAALDIVSADPEAFVLDTINNGREDTLMPAWSEANGGPLSDEEIQNVAAFVLSLDVTMTSAPTTGDEPLEPTTGGGLLLLIVGAGVLLLVVGVGVMSQRRSSS